MSVKIHTPFVVPGVMKALVGVCCDKSRVEVKPENGE
jgi:hypothetical protein